MSGQLLFYGSGDICEKPGVYRYLHYFDGTEEPPPDRLSIYVVAGDLFPAMQDKGCVWIFVRAE